MIRRSKGHAVVEVMNTDREHIDRYESAKFLDDVLNIIASSMDD